MAQALHEALSITGLPPFIAVAPESITEGEEVTPAASGRMGPRVFSRCEERPR